MIVIKTNDGPRGFRFQGNDLRIDSSTVVVVVALISYGYLKVESGFERVKSRRRGKVATHTCLIAGVLDLKSSVSDLINIGYLELCRSFKIDELMTTACHCYQNYVTRLVITLHAFGCEGVKMAMEMGGRRRWTEEGDGWDGMEHT
ncbi:hypothetical protein G5I_05098 [Acromyrmex echinatior]|uniref:Uncharacterized protein n=1 Tax=Acromyrmex echinatior TaxID=103372 RepID=F4WHD8_ACREC|nr:hypothetical protein G5I_05098 [Acromyrmex echinatior]